MTRVNNDDGLVLAPLKHNMYSPTHFTIHYSSDCLNMNRSWCLGRIQHVFLWECAVQNSFSLFMDFPVADTKKSQKASQNGLTCCADALCLICCVGLGLAGQTPALRDLVEYWNLLCSTNKSDVWVWHTVTVYQVYLFIIRLMLIDVLMFHFSVCHINHHCA